MKKVNLVWVFLIVTSIVKAQYFFSKTTDVSFFSETKMENIDAKNSTVTSVLNTTNNEIVVKISNTSFKFRSALMEEHFNENYMESTKFPVSEFKGKIEDKLDYTKDGKHDVLITGKLTIHGVTKEVTIPAQIEIVSKTIKAASKFKIKLADYDIKVPALYALTIAEDVEISIRSALEPYKK